MMSKKILWLVRDKENEYHGSEIHLICASDTPQFHSRGNCWFVPYGGWRVMTIDPKEGCVFIDESLNLEPGDGPIKVKLTTKGYDEC